MLLYTRINMYVNIKYKEERIYFYRRYDKRGKTKRRDLLYGILMKYHNVSLKKIGKNMDVS